MNTLSCSDTLSQLQQVFPGVLMIDSHATATALGIAYKTLNNAGDNFPIRSVKFGNRKLYRLVDIANYVDQQLGIIIMQEPSSASFTTDIEISTTPSQPKRGRGRPPKIAKKM